MFKSLSAPSTALVLYSSTVPAGFPSPADDDVEMRLDINSLVAKRPAATFYARATGDSMVNAGISDGDLLVVDRSITPTAGDIVVAVLDGGLTVKRLARCGQGWQLAAENPAFRPLPINPEDGVTIWGVVTFSLRRHCEREG